MAEKKRGKEKKKDKMKNRRGLSTVIVTLILVLISIVAIALLWVPVKNLINQQLQSTQERNKFFNEQMNIIDVYSNYPFVNITIKKPAGEITSSGNATSSSSSGLQVNIYSVMDLSGSMRACNGSSLSQSRCTALGGVAGSWNPPVCDDLPQTAGPLCTSYGATWDDRITAAANANAALISSIFAASSTSKIGLSAFGTASLPADSLDLTNNAVLLSNTMLLWNVSGSTCICCGINDAAARLQAQSSPGMMKSIILLSDGGANIECTPPVGAQNDPQAIADAITAAGNANASLPNLVIYTVGVGNSVDTVTMTKIANAGDGQYFSVVNSSQLIGIYQSIANQIQSKYTSLTAFNYLYLKLYNGTNSYMVKETGIPDVLQSMTYNVNLQGQLSGTITRIEVYPVILNPSGQEVIGPMITYWQAF